MRSYEIPDFGTIQGFQTIVVGYTLDGGAERGAQFAQAIPHQFGASLVNTDHTVEWAFVGGHFPHTYYFWVRNERQQPTKFKLSGIGHS